ncbi:metal ABC transporter substrate-binding protein [Oscillospiraceae bacterium PP1C4]
MQRRLISILLAAVLCLLLLAGCAPAAQTQKATSKIRIVATLFPQYDFARQIAGDKADIKLLLPAGIESHSYEPTPADIIAINMADLFVYTGPYMEPWAQSIIDGVTENVTVLNISQNITLDKEEEHDEAHAHDEALEHDEADAHKEELAHGGFDPHIWTSPVNAKVMVDNLTDALCKVDSANADYYRNNAAKYKTELDALDQEFSTIVSTAKRKEIIFGGRFALHYFAKQYGLTYEAAFDSCSHETEPSAQVVAEIIDEVRTKGIPVVFHEELTDPKVARLIGEETGAKLRLLHSCHNVSKEDFQNGATYLSLMKQNALYLKEGLN